MSSGGTDGRPAGVEPLRSTISGVEVQPLYTEPDVELDYERDLGAPGEFPYTRGVYPTMYRGRLWTMRQFAGFGSPEDTNRRFRYLLEHGQTGLSTAFDMPTLMGLDSDHPRSLGEVGREGVAIDSLEDMATLFAGIPLGEVSTSMTINSAAAILVAFYVCVAERQGVSPDRLRGTAQTDILKEYIAQKEWIFPPEPSMRLVTDLVEYCTRELPLWQPISISGYHIREAGSTAAQELAFTLADGFAYVEWAVERGLDVDEFAPRLSFFFNAHIDFFEEIAKYRAARRIWARELRDRFGARDPRSWLMRFHTQTAGVSLTAQQPEVNIVRTAIEALAAVLGGTQSLHTNSFDEALALPTENAVRIALRTQQVIAHETGVVNTADPLGGSYYLEHLTERARTPGLRVLRPHRRARRHGRGDQAELLPDRDRGGGVHLSARGRARRTARRRRQLVPARRRRATRDPPHRPGDRAHPDRASEGPTREPRLGRRRSGARPAQGGRLSSRPQPDGTDPRRRQGRRHGRRDVRRVARGLGHLARDVRLLSPPGRRVGPDATRASTRVPPWGRCGARAANLPEQHRVEEVEMTSTVESNVALRPFRVEFPDEALADLRRRIGYTRWPDRETVPDHSQGVQLATIQALARYWGSDYDWRSCEASLNALPQFLTEIDGLDIHFVHVRSEHEDALPLVVTHGWPGSIIEQLKLVEPLTNPTAHGGSAADAFHVVIPSLPGYGFSGKPTSPGWDPARIARAWVTLMKSLGYSHFVATGGDWGGLITELMGAQAPPELLGIHSNFPGTVPAEIVKALASGSPAPSGLSADEARAYGQLLAGSKQRGYAAEMETRPQSLSGLVDTPVGLATWMLDHDAVSEEQLSHTIVDGQPFGAITRDDIIDNVTLYWLTNTAISSARLYWENEFGFFGVKNISIPVAVSVFPGERYQAPHSWAERAYPNLVYFNELDRGGHFAAWEQPDLFSSELRAAFRSLR